MKDVKLVSNTMLSNSITRRDFLRLAGTGSIALLLSACQPGWQILATESSNNPIEIRYATGGAMPPTEIEIAIFSEAMQKNVLKNYGKEYTVTIITTKGTPEAQTLLIAGQADFATLAFSTIATTVIKNAIPDGISIVASQYIDGKPGYGTNAYLVLGDSGIESPNDLKGKTLGVNAIGTAVDIILRVYLRKHGLDPEKDVKFAEVGFGAMGAALRERRIDLGSFVQPFQALELKTGGVKPLFLSTDAVKSYSAIATVARNDFLKEHSAAVRAMLKDWVIGLEWLMDENNRDQAIEIMSDISKTPPETLGLFYGVPGTDYYRNPQACPDAQALQVGVDAMVAEGFLDQRVEIAPLVDTSFLPNPCS